MREFLINENDSGQRVDKFLQKAMPDLPKSMMYRLIRKKDIKVNGKRCEISTKLVSGDTVRVYVRDEVAGQKQHDMSFLKASALPQIAYEDENILIACKEVGVDSHSNGSSSGDTLIDRIKLYLYNKGEFDPSQESSFAPALCSRLDRNTSGLVTAAKNALALRLVNGAIAEGNVHKVYLCVTVAPPPKEQDIITAYHRKDESRNIVEIRDTPAEEFREIRTGYQVLSQNRGLSLVKVTLYTGRTHQIRAHLAHISAPLLGDGKYGDVAKNKRWGVFRQALCAWSLEFAFEEDSPLVYLNALRPTAPMPEFIKYFPGYEYQP